MIKELHHRIGYQLDEHKLGEIKSNNNTNIQEKVRLALYVQRTTLQFSADEARNAGYVIHPDELAAIVCSYVKEGLRFEGCIEGLLKKVSVALDIGVREKETSKRREIYGYNRYKEKPSKSFLVFVWKALHNLKLIILIFCALVSLGFRIDAEGWPKGAYDGLGTLLGILLVVLVTSITDYKQSLVFKDLNKENEKKVDVYVTRDGLRKKVPIYDLVVGDIVHLSIGDRVPADGVFISGYSLLIDESSLSGESEPMNIGGDRPFLLSGTKVLCGFGTMLVTAVGARTEWGRSMETRDEDGEDKTMLQGKLNDVAIRIGKFGLIVDVCTFLVLIGSFLSEKSALYPFARWTSSDALKLLDIISIALTIMVITAPEGSALAMKLSHAFSMKKLMDERTVVRDSSACETMGSASCICTNKTGILTSNYMIVSCTWVCEKIMENGDHESVNKLKSEISEDVLGLLLQCIFQNTSCEVIKDKDGHNLIVGGTPTESAILEFGMHLGGDYHAQRIKYKILKVEPFISVRKKISVLVALPNGGVRAFVKGSFEIILSMCDKFIDSNGESTGLTQDKVNNATSVINGFADEALVTLCLAFKDIEDSSNKSIPDAGYTLIAVVGIKNPVRPGVKEAVKTCLAAGITVRMVTGDNINTAKAIAKECGILTDDGEAMEGLNFRNLSPEEVKKVVPKLQVMARSLPEDKYKLVNSLQNMFGEVVAVVGDEIDDAQALHESDIGLTMAMTGTKVGKNIADVNIIDDNFSTIVNVARWGRALYINAQKCVQFQLTVSVTALMINYLSVGISGSASLSSVHLLWINLIKDTLGALALTTEPPNYDLMQRPPIPKSASFITEAMSRNIIGQSIYQLSVLVSLNFRGKQLLGLTGPDSTKLLNTLVFNSFVFCQVFNEINSRGIEKMNIFQGIFQNRIFLGVMAFTVLVQIIIVQVFGALVNAVPLSWKLWGLCLLVGFVSMPVAAALRFSPAPKQEPHTTHEDERPLIPYGPDMV